MKEIPLTQGKVALVDDADYEELARHKWFACNGRCTFYPVRNPPRRMGERRLVYMHRILLPTAKHVDHKNGNGLDNRRENLRECTPTQNHMNQRPRKGCSSKYKGVYWDKHSGKWCSQIRMNGRRRHLGLFINEHDAARAYDVAARELFGEFARLNSETHSAGA